MRRTISFSIEGPIAPDALAPLGELEWRLTGLSIANCPVEDADLHWLSRLPALESLGLSGTRVSDISLERVAQSPLRYVDLSGTAVTDQVFSHLAHVRTLEYLDLSETGIRGQGLAEFTDMPNLDYVNLSETLLDDDGAAHLARLPAVSSLNLADTAISDAGLASLGDAPALVNLVVDNTAIHGEGLAGLSRAATIRYLYLDCKQLNDESLRHLVDLPSLSSLKLGDCSIGDSGFGHLARIDGLVGLTISGTHLTPAIGPALERMANLRALSFRGEVSNEVLALLAEQRGLESLHLSRARYHEDAANALAAARPDLYVQR